MVLSGASCSRFVIEGMKGNNWLILMKFGFGQHWKKENIYYSKSSYQKVYNSNNTCDLLSFHVKWKTNTKFSEKEIKIIFTQKKTKW
jgi:hypothetical protein